MRRNHWIRILPLFMLVFGRPLLADRVHLLEGTPIRVRLKTDMNADLLQVGDRVDLEVAQPVVVKGLVVIPEGAAAWGGVQSTKKKEIRFDIEGIKLINQVQIKLRTIPEKSKKSGKDQLKIDSAAATRGSEFTAYVDEDVDLEGVPAQAGTAVPPRPSAATTPPPSPAPAAIAPNPLPTPPPTAIAPPTPTHAPIETRPQTPTVSEAPKPALLSAPLVAKPSTPRPPVPTPAISPPPPAAPTPVPVIASPAPQPPAGSQVINPNIERINVEFYSEPLGADILIDGNFVGNTPSILKVPIGTHRLEIQLSGYKTVSDSLQLLAGADMSTIRKTLEKKE